LKATKSKKHKYYKINFRFIATTLECSGGRQSVFKSWLRRNKTAQPRSTQLLQSVESARISDGQCIYAVGDIHGMFGLWTELHRLISEDAKTHHLETDIVILGDMVDRGPDSRKVIESLLDLHVSTGIRTTLLKGNHEQMLLGFLTAPEDNGPFWLRNGGVEALHSYGVYPPDIISHKQWKYVRDEFLERMPPVHLDTLKNLPSKFIIDDYFFCHASIKEGQELGHQGDEDLLWSRRFPNDSWGPQEKIIVHGHQPVAQPLIEKFHINVDTGAYATGRLTCVKLWGNERKFIQTVVKT
jgi:serine/threonine protein phosphatase 1